MPLDWSQIEPATDEEMNVHRKLTESNLVAGSEVMKSGRWEVMDFAIAKMIRRWELDRDRIAELEASNAHLMKLAAVMSDPMGFKE